MPFIRMVCVVAGMLLSVVAAEARPVSLAVVGDIMLGGSAAATLRTTGYDYPFAALAARLHGCDTAVGNLEAPVTASGSEFTGKKFRFKVDARAVPALRRAGFGVLTLANNHMMDFGTGGLTATLQALEAGGIGHAGAGLTLAEARQPALVTLGGMRLAFLAYSLTYPAEFFAGPRRPGTAPGLPQQVAADIARARQTADSVVVSFHWGGEGESLPRAYQIAAAHLAVDCGADLVIGHHPHVLQGVERYGKGVILYSLGNFAFGSMSRTAGESVLARVVLDGGVTELELVPLDVLNPRVRYQPHEVTGAAADRVIARMNRLSARLNSRFTRTGGRYLLQPP